MSHLNFKVSRTVAVVAICSTLVMMAQSAWATWRYVASSGKWNNQNYTGYVTDDTKFTIFVVSLGNNKWQLGVYSTVQYGSCNAGTEFVTTGVGSGHLDIRAIADSPISSRRQTFSTVKREACASATSFSPSTTKSPSCSRNFF